MSKRSKEEVLAKYFTESYDSPEFNDIITEVERIIKIVISKHFSNYAKTEFEKEFIQMCLTELLFARESKKFDPSKCAKVSDYIYSSARNLIRNFLVQKDNNYSNLYLEEDENAEPKLAKESPIEFEGVGYAGLRETIDKYLPFIEGTTNSKYKVMSTRSAVELIFDIVETCKECRNKSNIDNKSILYNLLKQVCKTEGTPI